MKRNTLVLLGFLVLFLAAALPFGFTKSPEPYLFGWLPFPLFYWWTLVLLIFVFILWVTFSWLKEVRKEQKK